MELTTILFYAFSLLTVGCAGYMVFSRNIVHAAFALIFTLSGVAALYVLLYADFVAATQILVYVGGILILILFGIMLTTINFSENLKTVTVNMLPASLLAGSVGLLLIYLFSTANWKTITPLEREDTMFDLGMMLMTEYLLPFQVAGVLLLVAIVGALYMSTRKRTES